MSKPTLPTLKVLCFRLIYTPKISVPPDEPPALKHKPAPKPARVPPTKHTVSKSSSSGINGLIGMSDIAMVITAIEIIVLSMNFWLTAL